MPLRNEGWTTAVPNPDQVMMTRRGEAPDETFMIQGLLVKLPPLATAGDLALFVKESQSRGTDRERFRMVRHEVSGLRRTGTTCARSYVLAEELVPAAPADRTGHLFFETLTVTCAHPRNPNIGVNVSYSHRSYVEHRDPRFIEHASGILDSVEFNDL